MADPRPMGQPVFTPSPDYQYFLFDYVVTNIDGSIITFDALGSIGLMRLLFLPTGI